jgi:hypothetical protein
VNNEKTEELKMKKAILFPIILVGLLAGCNSKTKPVSNDNSDSGGSISTSQSGNISNEKTETVTEITNETENANSTPQNSNISTSQTQAVTSVTDVKTALTTKVMTPITTPVTTAITTPPEKVGDGKFLVESKPKSIPVEINCTYGSAEPTEKITVNGKTIDFSVLGNESEGLNIPYCILPDSTVYYSTYLHLYKSDTTLTNRELLLKMDVNRSDLPCSITQLFKLNNSEFLFFIGSVRTTPNDEKKCLGALNLQTGEVNFQTVAFNQYPKIVPCNAGVLVYGGGSGSAWYWENGKITEIVLRNKNETDLDMHISANGKYICSFMQVMSNGNLVERYSVYDAETGAFIRSFDWTFDTVNWGGFTFLDINEETKSVYVYDSHNGSNIYQFYFGG